MSKPHRAFHPLCCPRCVQCTGALCGEGDDTSHSVFCPTLGDGELRIGGTTEVMAEKGGGGQKANLQRATVLQSCCAQRLIKRNFMSSCTRCNCGVPEDTESRAMLCSAPGQFCFDGVGWAEKLASPWCAVSMQIKGRS